VGAGLSTFSQPRTRGCAASCCVTVVCVLLPNNYIFTSCFFSQMSITLPQVTIQHDFQTVIAEVQEGIIPEEPFWISCYKHEHESVHGKVKVQRAGRGRVDLFSEGDVVFQRGEHVRLIACEAYLAF
jgi:hypothetical protein